MEVLICPITGDKYNPCVYKSCPCIQCNTPKQLEKLVSPFHLEINNTQAKKDDNGKPEAIYFYWLGLYALTNKFQHEAMNDLISNLRNNEIESALITLDNLLQQYILNSKLNLDLCNVSLVSKFGANKYGLLNYRNGFPWSRLVNSLGRHILKEIKGEPDPDTNLCHELHTLANIFMLADHIKHDLGYNDIPELLGGN